MFSNLIWLLGAVALVAGKPVPHAKNKVSVPSKQVPAIPSISNEAAKMTCDEWMDTKMEAHGMTMEELAAAIVEPQYRELALEFLLFCMMDETPVEQRESALQSEIMKASQDY